MEQITPSGANDSTTVGKRLLKTYPKLVPTLKRVFADKKSRTQDSAKALIKAFPQDDVKVIEISEDEEYHSVIPHKYCPNFSKEAGDGELEKFIEHYTKPIVSRLQPFSPVKLTSRDIVAMQQFCGYESAITGKNSPLCDIFTSTEWMGYEYAWDVKYQYMVGHGNPLSPYLGFPWLNVTSNLFSNIEEASAAEAVDDQRFFVSFTHREVPPFIATALGLFNSTSSALEDMPTDRINFGRSWRMAELIPFLGHIGIEKLSCDASSGALREVHDQKADKTWTKEFVRIVANAAPRPIPRCQDGPGASCPFQQFKTFVTMGMEQYGDFHSVCGDHEKVGVGASRPLVWQN
ncbi:hypothetical protein FH972_020976 [Carpinus fangiana]|uniref:Acid phosphatase n=1 Tax=Carpinus fangiana TaxID=176857 RepID=A0A5N6KNK3_9ROSI|nr:hypothetical protein FH972_020976 [Carpinus fangiana]